VSGLSGATGGSAYLDLVDAGAGKGGQRHEDGVHGERERRSAKK
jgi:hypothetical protein